MKRLTLLVWAFFCFAQSYVANAQKNKNGTEITGTVRDSKGIVLPSVTVKVKGKNISAITDENGKFSIKVPEGSTILEISSVGFADQEIKIGVSKDLAVELKEDSKRLDDVVVVGYGTQKRKDLTGSISSVKSDQMNLGGVTSNAAQAIQGRAAGVQVSQGSDAPGGQTIVRIRGGNSIKSTNEPLYVVDGFPSETGIDINPNDIDDIQILKDASATAIYGARGANGVVMITTKRGKAGKTVIQYNGYYGTQKVIQDFKEMTGLQDMQVTNAKAAEKGNPPYFSSIDLASGNNNNWFKLATRPSLVQSHDISVSGGNSDTKIALSGNYYDQKGVLRNTDYSRYSTRLNVDKQFHKNFKVGANIYFARSFSNYKAYDGTIVPSNVMYGIVAASPAVPVYNSDGSFARFKGRDNPLAWLLAPTNQRFINKFNANAFGEYQIIGGLSLRVSGGTEYTGTKEGTYLPTDLVQGEDVKGKASVNDVSAVRDLIEGYLTYKTTIAEKHSLNVVMGVSKQSDVLQTHYTEVQKFSTDAFLYYNLGAGAERIAARSSRIDSKISSAYGRLNYAWEDRYLATFTFRADQSTRFGPNKRVGYFPSGSIAWRVSNENFMKNSKLFSDLKLRASYGTTGNDRIPDNLFLTGFAPTNVTLDGNNSYPGTVSANLPNANLRWESTAQLNIGVDMGFMDGRITSTIELYRKKTNDLLLDIPIGDWQGFSSQTGNAGAIENKGIELSINTENINTKDFKWTGMLNVAYNKQKCLDLGGRPYIISQIPNPYGGRAVDFTKLEPGKELSSIYGYIYTGVIKSKETHTTQPNSKPGDPKYKDMNGDGVITPADRTYLGNANPHYIFGFNNDFSYKGVELGIFLQGAADFFLFNTNHLILESGHGVEALNRWTTTNENTDIPRDGYAIAYGGYVNSRFIENASYLRVKMITLGYNIPLAHTFLKSVKKLKDYGNAENLLTITNYKGTDPEVNTKGGNSNLVAGQDYTAFPSFRSFTIGLQLNF